MKQQEFIFANGRLIAMGSSKHSVRVYIRVGENDGLYGFISIKNFIYMLNNPDADFDVECIEEHQGPQKLPNDELIVVKYPTTLWIAPYKPCRF